MLKNTLINIEATKKVAKALGELNQRVVYVGGAVVSLYIDDPAADDVRPTKDIDISFEIASSSELEHLRENLYHKGFRQSHEDEVICRFRYEDIKVDVMATKEVGWAPANPWFAPGFKKKEKVVVDATPVFILPLEYYLATKFAAFKDRGGTDPRTSHDFEDIVYLLNYSSNIKEVVLEAEKDVQLFLKSSFIEITSSDILQEAVMANLYYEDQTNRFNKIIELLKEITNQV